MVGNEDLPSRDLKILSWNINGIRTVKNLKQKLDELEADIICLQETKVTRDMIDEPTALVEGYNAYFSFSRGRSGYSGVATFCRERTTPLRAEEGLSGILQKESQSDNIGCIDNLECEFTQQELKRLDSEGRTIITQHKVAKEDGSEGVLTLFNVYCPRADPERPDRLDFKLRFNKLLELRAQAVKRSGSFVMIVGDINISHRRIDRCENVDPVEFEDNPSRQWLNSFLVDYSEDNTGGSCIDKEDNLKMVDSFRYFHPNVENAFTCWNTKINARATNYGSRIDYIFADRHLILNMVDSLILSEVQGSDHCPVVGVFNLKPIKAAKCPSECIKNFPEFSGVQQKLSAFFVKKSEVESNTSSETQETTTEHEFGTSKRKCPEGDERQKELRKIGNFKKLKTQGISSQKQISSFFMKATHAVDDELDGSCSQSSSQSSPSGISEGSSAENGIMEELTQNQNAAAAKYEKNSPAALAWRSMLTGPRPPPLCKGHKEPCVERIVKKKGPNFNRKFFACARGEGSRTDPRARCDHFEWAMKK